MEVIVAHIYPSKDEMTDGCPNNWLRPLCGTPRNTNYRADHKVEVNLSTRK